MNAGDLVFNGTQAGVLLGYVERDDEEGNPIQRAIVARFAGSDEVDPVELGGSPSAVHPDGPEAGAVPADPSTDNADAGDAPATTGSDPASVAVAEGRANVDPPETETAREQRQDQELAALENRTQDAPGAGPEAPAGGTLGGAGVNNPTAAPPSQGETATANTGTDLGGVPASPGAPDAATPAQPSGGTAQG